MKTIEEQVWEKVTAPIIGGVEPRVIVHEYPSSPDQRELVFLLRSSFAHRPGQGSVRLAISDDFAAEPIYGDMLEYELRRNVAAKCPYSRQFLEGGDATRR